MGEASWTPDAEGEEILHLGPNDDLDLSDWIEMNGGWSEVDDNDDESDTRDTRGNSDE